jgi:hypothetical protein
MAGRALYATLGLLTPASVHFGQASDIITNAKSLSTLLMNAILSALSAVPPRGQLYPPQFGLTRQLSTMGLIRCMVDLSPFPASLPPKRTVCRYLFAVPLEANFSLFFVSSFLTHSASDCRRKARP